MKMQFCLAGFSQDQGFRVFAFERVAEDRTRTPCTVRADLALSRTYGIRMQDLPLLCQGFLEQHDDGVQLRPMTFGEDDMRLHADHAANTRNEAAQKKRPPRRVQPGNGTAARPPQPMTASFRSLEPKAPSA